MERKRGTVIITHTDLDGIAGAALYIYCKGVHLEEADVTFSSPQEAGRKLLALIREARRAKDGVERVVIIDIGPSKEVVEALRSAPHINVEWYDHHVWPSDILETVLKGTNVHAHISPRLCSTGLVREAACKDREDSAVDDFSEAVCEADMWRFRRWEAAFLYRLADLVNSDSWRRGLLGLMLKALKEGSSIRALIDYMSERLEDYVDAELNELHKAVGKANLVQLGNVTVALYFKSRSIPASSILGNYLLSRTGAHIVALVNEDLKALSFRSRDCDVRLLASELGGGGHPRASGAPLHVSRILRMLHKTPLLRGLIERSLARKIVKVLRELHQQGKIVCDLEGAKT